MARKVRNAKIDTRSARAKLSVRREPYWTVLSRGCALGYRRGIKGGTWITRFRDDAGRQQYEALGATDDVRDPDDDETFDYKEADKVSDEGRVFSFGQAQKRARAWFDQKAKEQAGERLRSPRWPLHRRSCTGRLPQGLSAARRQSC